MLLRVLTTWLFYFLVQLMDVRCEYCETGKRQSPIDIISADTRYQEFRPFHLSGHDLLSLRAGSIYATNYKGSTIKLKTSNGHTKAFVTGGPLNVPYQFVEMHLHWGNVDDDTVAGSEHSVDGVKFPLELHMVHKNIHDETLKDALSHENGITVLGFKFQVVDDEKPPRNEGMDHLATIVENFLIKPNSTFKRKNLAQNLNLDVNVMNFLPVMMDDYFHYQGSLTTGTCDEAVNWIVFKNPLAVTKKNLRAFQKMQATDGTLIKNNFRPTQEVNGRPIYYHGLDLLRQKMVTREKCLTHTGETCIFPFTYAGVTHHQCTLSGGFDIPWCSTRTDRLRKHIWGNYGYCSSGCPGTQTDSERIGRLKKRAKYKFLLTLLNCRSSPKPAPMWDPRKERWYSRLWRLKAYADRAACRQ